MTEPAITEPATVAAAEEPRLPRFLDHLQRFAEATAERAQRWLTPLRVYAALILLSAFWSAWRLSSGGWDFLIWAIPLSLPAALLFAFYLVFSMIAELPRDLAGLRQALVELTGPVRTRLDALMDRGEGSRFGFGRVLAIGHLLLELRRVDDLRQALPNAVGLAPLMANPLFWLLLAFTSLVGLAVLGLAALLLLLAL